MNVAFARTLNMAALILIKRCSWLTSLSPPISVLQSADGRPSARLCSLETVADVLRTKLEASGIV